MLRVMVFGALLVLFTAGTVQAQVTGACCLPDGRCEGMELESCTSLEGFYQGDGTACGAMGACDVGESCVETTEDCCLSDGGTYDGDGTSCPEQLIPTVSVWGLFAMALLMLTAGCVVVGCVVFIRRSRRQAA